MLAVLAPGVAPAQPPDHFELLQNVPDPFCPLQPGGVTDISFALPQSAGVIIEVWDPDTSMVVRTLTSGLAVSGYHSVIWDGRDDSGTLLPAGSYPYSMTALDPKSDDLLFYAVLIATMECPQATEAATLGEVKRAFVD
jgi:hypothetical protein